MPRLYQRPDGGYYLRGRLPPHGAFVTWQVTDEGIRLLRESYHLPVDTPPCEVSLALCRELILQGLAYTHGGGISGMPQDSWTRPEPPAGTELRLALHEDETDGWYLALLIPEVPAHVLEGISASALLQRLQAHRFSIEGAAQPLPALDLWPGRGGAACPVLPQTDPYIVRPEPQGEWLPGWQLGTAPRTVPGLVPHGTVFAGADDGGVRLTPGEQLEPDHPYYLVAQPGPAAHQPQPRPAGLPATVSCRPLGRRGAWAAWAFTLPPGVDDAVRSWCAGLGHPLAQPPWRLVLLAPPPHRYLADGVPVIAPRQAAPQALLAAVAAPPVAAGIRVVVERDGREVGGVSVTPRDVATGEQTPVCYLALPLPAPGMYRLRAASGRVAPLRFFVEALVADVPSATSDPAEVLRQPPALTVCLAGSEPVRLHAFAGGAGPHEVAVAVPPPGGAVLTVDCLVPLDIEWSCAHQRLRWQSVPAQEVPARLQADLLACLSQGQAGTLTFDAGTFGRLAIHLHPLQGVRHDRARGGQRRAPQVREQVRWLARAVPALARREGVACTPLPQAVRRALAALAEAEDCPEAADLAREPRVPVALLPHLQALVRAWQARCR